MKRTISIGILLIVAGLASIPPAPAHPSFNVGHALTALANGDLETAGAQLNKARFAMPDSPEIQYNLGVVSYRKRDYALAVRHFAMAVAGQASSDTRFSSLYNMGNATFRMGDYAAAVSAYEGCLELKKDAQAEYNLKVAREKLQKQLEKQQQQQQQQNDESSGRPGDEKSQNYKEQQSQSGDNQQDQDAQSGQGNSSGKKDGENSADRQAGTDKKDEAAKPDDAKDGQKSDTDGAEQGKQKDPGSSEQDSGNASGTQELTERQEGGGSEPGEDVQMQTSEPAAKDMPEASQRARALRNTKVNPYMIEKILKEMERREKEAQLYYRNEPRRSDEIDPFEMDAQQLREWMEKRRRPQAPKPSDAPDW